ncbi:MAG TPA: hypothetical protein VM165_04965 [Planctomycetaceae bacterium]|nr:hypothetical protein [Planctomycetaceae bacterium]
MFRTALGSGLAFVVCSLLSLPAQADIGSSMVTFLQGKVNTRVGGGECAHLATEALRANGGEFVPADLGADSPAAGDSMWGTLVTVISYANNTRTDSNPANACLPGDVIQYGAGTKIGTATYSARHTSVVSVVNATTKRPTSVYQQNFGGVRTVKTATIDVTNLTAGWIRIYRPKARVDATNKWKVTVVNSATTSQTYTIKVDTSTVSTVTLTAANTAGSFRVQTVTTTGTVPCLVLSNGQSLFLQNAKGDEIYNPTTSTIGARQLSQ